MAPIVDDDGTPRTVTYPKFDHGTDLFVLYTGDGLVEFRTSRREQFVRTDSVVNLGDMG